MSLVKPVVILANGAFPEHELPLEIMNSAGTLVCCDGAANSLINYSRKPDIVIGDLDSLSTEAMSHFYDILVPSESQEIGDLEKAVNWIKEQDVEEASILGATGRSDDRSLGNLLLLYTDLGMRLSVFTDTGHFSVVRSEAQLDTFAGQSVSLFTDSPSARLTTVGLAYPLHDEPLTRPHSGTSNRSLGETITISVEDGVCLVSRAYE